MLSGCPTNWDLLSAPIITAFYTARVISALHSDKAGMQFGPERTSSGGVASPPVGSGPH